MKKDFDEFGAEPLEFQGDFKGILKAQLINYALRYGLINLGDFKGILKVVKNPRSSCGRHRW